MIHACTLKDGAVVGSNAVINDGAVVEAGAVVKAGAFVPVDTVVTKGTVRLPRSLACGLCWLEFLYSLRFVCAQNTVFM